MTLGSGCGSKTLIRIGGGNLKSVVVFIVAERERQKANNLIQKYYL